MALDSLTTLPPLIRREGAETPRDEGIAHLKEVAFDVLLAASEPLKTLDVAQAVMERCGVDPSDETAGNFAGLVRLVLDSDLAFLHENRQWQLAARQPRPDADRRRPVEGFMEGLIDAIGKPIRPAEVAPIVAAVYGRTDDLYEGMLRQLAYSHASYFLAAGKRVALARWLIDTSAADPEEVALDNFEEPEGWRSYAPSTPPEADTPREYAFALLGVIGRPVPSPALLYLVWRQFPDTEPQALFNDLLQDTRLALAGGPVWMLAETYAARLTAVRDLVNDPDLAASVLATAVPVVEEEAAPVVRVGETDLDQVFDYMNSDLRSFRLSELCQQVLESFPGSRTFASVRDVLRERMLADPRFIWVGTERFRLDGTLPDEVQQVPEGLAFDERDYSDEEFTEGLLPVDRWKYALDEQILHSLVQDLGDDDSARSSSPPARLRVSPPLHHYIVGTFYVRNEQRGLLPTEPDLVEFSLLTPDGGRIDVWINNRLGLVYGLKEWYDANLPWTGGAFTLEATDTPDEFRLIYEDDREALVDIPMERLQKLLLLRGQAEAEEMPLTDVLTQVLREHPQGTSFETIFTEVNVVRRVTRALVASVLSAHRGFQQRPEQPGLWFYDERRAEKSQKKTKKPKRFREVEEEEEELEA